MDSTTLTTTAGEPSLADVQTFGVLGWMGLVLALGLVGWAVWHAWRARQRRSLAHELLRSMVDHAQRPRSSR